MASIVKKKFPSLSSIGPDGNTSFLRAARGGHLDKVLDHLKNNVDINTANSNGLNALHLASKDGHIHVVEELIKRGANLDAATKKGNTALHIASLAGQEEVVKLLVQHGASVNVQSQNGFTPLYMAAQENHDSVVKFLLANGANQSLATEDGFTPLAVAMQQGHDKVVAVLLENDTRGKVRLPALHIAAKKDDCKAAALLLQNEHNPDVTSKSGFTPLHISAHYGNEAIANLLLSKGANVNYSAKHNITPLHVAAKWGRANMVALLLEKGANIESKTRDGLTPLHCAARSGHEQVVDMLLERGAPISSKTKNGLSPLHMSAQGDFVDAARILLYHRAPVDDVTVDYLTALHVAAHCGNVRVAKLLLDRKADPNARALNGFTPLHIACKKNHIKVVELLLKQGASIEVTTESGLTPLHVASFMGAMNIVIFLLQNGANPDIPTVRGETPLHLAARANQTDIIRILLRNNAQVDARAREQQTPLHIASRLGNVDIVMLLLQHGAQVDSTTKDLYSALHIAAKEGQDEVASILLDNGASLNCTTKKGFTPSHLAAKHGHMKVASLLLQKDAPVDAQGKNGVTPLHVASHYDHQNVALLLLDKGASPHATAKNGHTPIHIAARKNQMDIATTLLEYGAKADVESKAGFTPLHLSSQEGHSDMSSLLIEHHADVNHKAKNGLTPLHLCAQEDKVNVASILIKNGAEVNAITKTGFTPLHVASHFGQLNMVRLLLAHDADPKITTNLGYSPLHQAAQQGHSTIVAILLDNGASPNIVNHQGQTALSIARKLGYISVVEVLKKVTDAPDNQIQITATDEKYKVVSPETMQENFLSDSEDEGGEDTILNEQPYRYLTVDEMKSLGDDSLPIDVTRDERFDSNLMMAMDDSISPQHSYNQMSAPIDNIDIKHQPNIGKLHWRNFLVSFLVDARGGAMRGCRHSGVRVIVPPRCASMPTRVTCRYLRRDKLSHPPPLMEGEALASRILELGPIGAKFLGPVMLEVPHFGSLRGSEREIVILRSDNGETWREHTIDNCDDIIQEVLSHSFEKEEQTQHDDTTRLTRIVTTEFPHYFAVVSRIRQEVHAIGPEGGMVSSSVVSQVQAVFPEGALTKKIKVGLQSQPIPGELVSKLLGNRVGVSPIVTVEPRRRKFHKPITLTIPVPQAASKGMINQYSGDAPTLRLLCSITGGTTRAQWEDVTGSTPLTFVNDCVSFTTTVSARFWLMDCRNVGDATKMATELYREAIHVPFMAKFVVFVKRIDSLEARLRIFCMTDDKEDKTLEHQEHFTEVAKSRDVEVLEGKSQYIEFAGNLVPVTKSGDQLKLGFRAFRENRLPFMVKVKDPHADPVGRVLFMREPKVAKGEPPQHPACVLNIVLPETIIPETGLSHSVEELNKFSYLQSSDTSRVDLRLSDISNLLGDDWVSLASELGLSNTEINTIKTDHPGSNAQLALAMLRYWFQQHGDQASAKELESSLTRIGRSDIVQQCIPQQESQKTSYQSSHIIKNADYATVKKQKDPIHEADDHDEKKYTAEEKVVEEEETKKSVQERKQEIEKRLSLSKNIDVILDQKPSEKRKSLIASDSQSSDKEKETVEEKRVSVVDPDVANLADELADLTFEQKRLSFEKGASLEKKKSEEKPFDGVQTSFDKGVSLERKISVDKPSEISKPTSEPRISEDKVEQTGGKVSDSIKSESAKIIEAEKQITEQEKSQASTETEEKQLSFQEKRLSFERGLSQTSITPVLKEKTEISVETKEIGPTAEEKRRNSVLFEGVSQGLEKLDTTLDKFSQPPQDLLSPKVVKTPPPSPAEFKDPAWSNSSSQSSQEGKAPDVDGAAQEAAKNNVVDSPTSDTTGKSDLCGCSMAGDRFSERKFSAERTNTDLLKQQSSDSCFISNIIDNEGKQPKKQNNADEILYEMSAQLSKVLQILKPCQDVTGIFRKSACVYSPSDPFLLEDHSTSVFSANHSTKCSNIDAECDTLDEVIVNLINRVNSYYPQNFISDHRCLNEKVNSSCNEVIRFENLDDYGSHLHLTSFQPNRRTSGQEELERIERTVEDMLAQVQLQEEFLARDEENLSSQRNFPRDNEIFHYFSHHQSSPGEELQLLENNTPSCRTRFFDHSMPRSLKKYETKVGLNSEWKKANPILISHAEIQENRNCPRIRNYSEKTSLKNSEVHEPKLSYSLRPETYLFRSIWYETEQRKCKEHESLYSDSESAASDCRLHKSTFPENAYSSSEAIDFSLSDSSQGDDADLSSFADNNERRYNRIMANRENWNPRQNSQKFTALPTNFEEISEQNNLHLMCRSNSFSSSSSLYGRASPTAVDNYYGRYVSFDNINEIPHGLERDENIRFLQQRNNFKSLQVEYFTPSQAAVQTTNNSGYCTWYSEPDLHPENNSSQEGEQAAVESGASGVESEEAASGTQGKTDKSS